MRADDPSGLAKYEGECDDQEYARRHERREDGNVEALALHVAGGADTGGSGRAFQQPGLPEGLSLVEDAQRNLLAVVCELHHAGQP